MTLMLHIASDDDLPALHGILQICGEHMHRTQKMSHWYPYRPLETFRQQTADATVYAIYDAGLLIGTFYLTATMRPHYAQVKWSQTDDARYLGGFGVLPHGQGRGIGTWAMAKIEAITQEQARYLRFDGVMTNVPLMRFYQRLGYTNCGDILFDNPRVNGVTCFQRDFAVG